VGQVISDPAAVESTASSCLQLEQWKVRSIFASFRYLRVHASYA
jgi:hypothetical protein